jgi:hypothetical protein
MVAMPSSPFGPGPPLVVRHSEEECDKTQRIFRSVAAFAFESAKETDPDFEEKLFADMQEGGGAFYIS